MSNVAPVPASEKNRLPRDSHVFLIVASNLELDGVVTIVPAPVPIREAVSTLPQFSGMFWTEETSYELPDHAAYGIIDIIKENRTQVIDEFSMPIDCRLPLWDQRVMPLLERLLGKMKD